jgi:hypothetical protein
MHLKLAGETQNKTYEQRVLFRAVELQWFLSSEMEALREGVNSDD